MSTLAVISLPAILHNALLVKRRAGLPLYAVVKDDGYGHGAAETAHTLSSHADAFCVATVGEGAALRAAGIAGEILVFCPILSREETLRARAYRLTVTADPASFSYLEEGMRAHIAVNTGMNRYGVRFERAESFARALQTRGVEVTGVYTHLYDAERKETSMVQIARFHAASRSVLRVFPHAVRHLGGTGALPYCGECDALRAGISLYGYAPSAEISGLRRAMKVYAPVAGRRIQLGRGAGYGECPLGNVNTLAYGYGDGFFRVEGARDLCMDAHIIKGSRRAGSYAVILCDAEEYAARHGTSVYEVLVRAGRGAAERRYIWTNPT